MITSRFALYFRNPFPVHNYAQQSAEKGLFRVWIRNLNCATDNGARLKPLLSEIAFYYTLDAIMIAPNLERYRHDKPPI